MAETEKVNIFNTIFREKPALLLIEVKNSKGNTYASSIAKKIDCTYSHAVKILKELEAGGIIKFEKQGRLKLLSLTKKGTELADYLTKIYHLVK